MGYRDKLKAAAAAARAGIEEGKALNAAHDPTEQLPLHGAAGRVAYGFEEAPKSPDRIEDPGEWERVMLADQTARDAARAAYLASDHAPLRITRVATRGSTQTQDVAEHLATSGLAARPELVYGLYRVPDRIRPWDRDEKGQVVEWDIVHAATKPLAPADAPADVFFEAAKPWVARQPGEPGVLDEDVALAYLQRAGIGPERTLGIARHVTINRETAGSGEGGDYLFARVSGIHVFHPRDLQEPASEPAASGPLTMPLEPLAGVQLETLRWEPIARVVHPVRQHRPRLPSAFPHLPLTPQELLRAYVEIVGIAPQDSYGVQVTYHRRFDLMGRTSTAKFITVGKSGGGDELPCADGNHWVRMHGGQHVVVTYRDRPAHAEGRARWAAYEAEVLESSLARGLDLRPPVPKPDSLAARTYDRIGRVVTGQSGDGDEPPRYCWPPAR